DHGLGRTIHDNELRTRALGPPVQSPRRFVAAVRKNGEVSRTEWKLKVAPDAYATIVQPRSTRIRSQPVVDDPDRVGRLELLDRCILGVLEMGWQGALTAAMRSCSLAASDRFVVGDFLPSPWVERAESHLHQSAFTAGDHIVRKDIAERSEDHIDAAQADFGS